MKHFKHAGLAAVAVLALGAIGASTASAALPEFVPGPPSGMESTIKKVKFQTVGGTLVTCKHGADGGSMTGPKTLSMKLFLFECSIPGALCTTAGKPVGEIETSSLLGTLGYIKKPMKTVGLDLASGLAPFMVFECGATPFVVEGSVIGRISPVNVPRKGGEPFQLKFAQTAGHQKPMSFEGEPIDVLQTSIGGAPFEESGLKATDQVFLTAAVEEIKA
jgi:hypothetical protein